VILRGDDTLRLGAGRVLALLLLVILLVLIVLSITIEVLD